MELAGEVAGAGSGRGVAAQPVVALGGASEAGPGRHGRGRLREVRRLGEEAAAGAGEEAARREGPRGPVGRRRGPAPGLAGRRWEAARRATWRPRIGGGMRRTRPAPSGRVRRWRRSDF